MNRTRINGRMGNELGNGLTFLTKDKRICDTVIRRRIIGVSTTIKMDRTLPPFRFGFSRGDGVLMVEPPHTQAREATVVEKRAFVGKVDDTLTDARIAEGRANATTYPSVRLRLDRLERIVGMVESLI
ncbi:MAG: hypothetical protein ABID61_00550 [Candidatus Micrarchaeota archaeon]